jgi:hypothetical protein
MSGFIKQKQRHFTTAKYYKTGHKLLLFLEPFSRLLFYASFAVLVSVLYLWQYALGIFGLRLIIQTFVLALVQKKLNEKGLLIFSIIFDIFSPVINGVLYFSNLRNKPGRNTWR